MKKTELLIDNDGLQVFQILEDCEITEVQISSDQENNITTKLMLNDSTPVTINKDLNVRKGMHLKTSIIKIDKTEKITGRTITGTNYLEQTMSPCKTILFELFGGFISYKNGIKTMMKYKDKDEFGREQFDYIVYDEKQNGFTNEELKLIRNKKGIGKYLLGLIFLWLILPLVYSGLKKIGFEKINDIISRYIKFQLPDEIISKLRVEYYFILAAVLSLSDIVNIFKLKKKEKVEKRMKKERQEKYRTTMQYNFDTEEDFYEYCTCKGLYANEKSDQFLGIPVKAGNSMIY